MEQRSRLERNEGEMRKEVWRQSEGCRSWSRSSWAPRLLQLWFSYRLELWCPSASIREGLGSSPSSMDATNATDDRLSVSLNRRRSPSSVRVLSDQRITLSGLKFKDSLETLHIHFSLKGPNWYHSYLLFCLCSQVSLASIKTRGRGEQLALAWCYIGGTGVVINLYGPS